LGILGKEDGLAVEAVILPPVVKVLTEPGAHDKAVTLVDGDIAIVEQGVDVLSKRDAILHMIALRRDILLNVRGFYDW
jgi:hypothetical protein